MNEIHLTEQRARHRHLRDESGRFRNSTHFRRVGFCRGPAPITNHYDATVRKAFALSSVQPAPE